MVAGRFAEEGEEEDVSLPYPDAVVTDVLSGVFVSSHPKTHATGTGRRDSVLDSVFAYFWRHAECFAVVVTERGRHAPTGLKLV